MVMILSGRLDYDQNLDGEQTAPAYLCFMNELEEGSTLQLDFTKTKKASEAGAVLPAVVQDFTSREVLVLGYVNEEALKKTMETGYVTFYSTSRKELWVKGDTSGNRLKLREVRVNCEQNSLLFLADLEGEGACHTRGGGRYRTSCYYRIVTPNGLQFV